MVGLLLITFSKSSFVKLNIRLLMLLLLNNLRTSLPGLIIFQLTFVQNSMNSTVYTDVVNYYTPDQDKRGQSPE